VNDIKEMTYDLSWMSQGCLCLLEDVTLTFDESFRESTMNYNQALQSMLEQNLALQEKIKVKLSLY
jgi:hypothetical protein